MNTMWELLVAIQLKDGSSYRTSLFFAAPKDMIAFKLWLQDNPDKGNWTFSGPVQTMTADDAKRYVAMFSS